MNATIDVLGKRLQALMGDVNFRSDYHRALESSEQLLEIGAHNLAEYEKIEAMPEERQRRIENLIWLILAEQIQVEALKKYGNSGDPSVRQFIENGFSKPEIELEWEKYKQLAKEGIGNEGLNDIQLGAVYHLLDLLPRLIIELIVEGVGRFRLLPRAEAPRIIAALVDMSKETEHADTCRHN